MTVAKLTKRRNRLEKQAQLVLDALVLDKKTQAEVAQQFKVSPAAISEFVRRHSVELVAQQEAAIQAATQYRISVKEWRISELSTLYGAAKADIASAETAQDKALMINTAAARLKQVAEELGQLPRPDQNINVKALMLVREIEGGSADVG